MRGTHRQRDPLAPSLSGHFRRIATETVRKHVSAVALLIAAAFGWLAGCDRETTATRPQVTVLVAASAIDAVEEVAAAFRRETGIAVRISSGPSNALARQILSGAPADVFLSASEGWATAVEDGGQAAVVRPLLTNRLVLIVPRGNPAGVRSPQDLMSEHVRRIALAGENVPAGRYADQALTSFALLEPLRSSDKFARGHDVRVALAFVERSEVEAGIVYATDAAESDRVEVVHEFDQSLHTPIVYSALLIEHGPAGDAGRKFFEYLFTPGASDIFHREGFRPVGEAL